MGQELGGHRSGTARRQVQWGQANARGPRALGERSLVPSAAPDAGPPEGVDLPFRWRWKATVTKLMRFFQIVISAMKKTKQGI